MQVTSYLMFDGRCDEAIQFYQTGLGAQVRSISRFKDMPCPSNGEMAPKVDPNKIMHAELLLGETTVMVSDGHCTGMPHFAGIWLSLSVSSEQEADRCFAALADGGQIRMPIGKTFFSPRFGMVIDRFGVEWMVIVPGQEVSGQEAPGQKAF